MTDWNIIDRRVLEDNAKPVVHMRRQFRDDRLGLVFGTGLTQPLGIPGWNNLNRQIASDDRVNGDSLLGAPSEETVKDLLSKGSYADLVALLGSGPEETIITQRLYEHFKAKLYAEADPDLHNSLALNADIQRQWRAIIREKLYGSDDGSPPDGIAATILKKHPYLKYLMSIVRRMPLTVTYNFDDVLELVLSGDRRPEEKELGRGYETTIDIRKPARSQRGVVYHPNGYIPRNTMEGGYEGIVLSEDEFADRMIETMTGQYASLSHHFLRSTCLFIGLSLKDSVLKNMLRQIARVTSGHYHYYVQYCSDSNSKPSKEERDAIRACNFGTYNLITLFLTAEEIASVGRLITCGYDANSGVIEDGEFKHLADEVGVPPVYHYYVVGAVGAGKSTVVSHLRDLVTHDEWVEDRLPELAEDWNDLQAQSEEDKLKRVDTWLARQFRQKNHILLDESVGIVVSDRCPLDPLVFTPKNDWKEKATLLLDTICPGRTTAQICSGQVIYLKNDPHVLDLRVRRTNKKYRRKRLDEMQRDIDMVYGIKGVKRVDAHLMSLVEIMQRVAHIIHMEDYAPSRLHERLCSVRKGELEEPLFDDQKTH